MRAESTRIYNAERISVHTADNHTLDGLIMRAKDVVANPELLPPEVRSVVLFCNPNAGYCEFAVDYQMHWIKFYAQRGFDVCFWNYRGYGQSSGSPTPENVVSDGEDVLRYLRSGRKYEKVVIHGESLGAAVAVKLAKSAGCNFLFSDRTFFSLTTLAELSVGKPLGRLMSWVTGWRMETAEDYIRLACPKVIGNDANDLMIHELASLRSGVARLSVLSESMTAIGAAERSGEGLHPH